MTQYIPYLEKAGWNCILWPACPAIEYSRLDIFNFKYGRYINSLVKTLFSIILTVWRILQVGRYDVVFLQRRLPNIGGSIFFELALRKFSRYLIFDFDDAIYMGWTRKNGFYADSRIENNFSDIVKSSDYVIAGNKYLANKTNSPSKTTVIPTAVDTMRFRPIPSDLIMKEEKSLIIGWTGVEANYPYLYAIETPLQKIFDLFPNATLKVISNKRPNPDFLKGQVKYEQWQSELEVEQLQSIDIGIMYLPDNEWTRGKCGFKIIQYMAVGKPVVASPVGVNLDIVKHGQNGYLAFTMDEWSEYLTRLMSDASHRLKLGQEAIHTVEQQFSIHSCLPILKNILEKAFEAKSEAKIV